MAEESKVKKRTSSLVKAVILAPLLGIAAFTARTALKTEQMKAAEEARQDFWYYSKNLGAQHDQRKQEWIVKKLKEIYRIKGEQETRTAFDKMIFDYGRVFGTWDFSPKLLERHDKFKAEWMRRDRFSEPDDFLEREKIDLENRPLKMQKTPEEKERERLEKERWKKEGPVGKENLPFLAMQQRQRMRARKASVSKRLTAMGARRTGRR